MNNNNNNNNNHDKHLRGGERTCARRDLGSSTVEAISRTSKPTKKCRFLIHE